VGGERSVDEVNSSDRPYAATPRQRLKNVYFGSDPKDRSITVRSW
jgi:hypothetical protein